MGEYSNFINKVHELTGINLSLYKEAQMKRRLTSLRNKLGYQTFQTYYDAIVQDKSLYDQFIDRITINVTEFYRNPKRWDVLRGKTFPELLNHTNKLSIWSAACSTGEEPYSIAIMLKEHFPHVHASIVATDIDDKALEHAREGIYGKPQLKDLPPHKIKKYFTFKNNKYYINNDLKTMVTFKKHDLLKDRYPSRLDLIVCRNVLIYFTDEAKEQIYTNFSASLKSNGILFVGSTEQIFNPTSFNLSLYATFFYQKQ